MVRRGAFRRAAGEPGRESVRLARGASRGRVCPNRQPRRASVCDHPRYRLSAIPQALSALRHGLLRSFCRSRRGGGALMAGYECARGAVEAITPAGFHQGRPSAVRAALSSAIEISIVIPIHNEAAVLEALFIRLSRVLDQLRMTHEIICVDDGSTDASLEQLLRFRAHYPALRVVSLSRNFGKDVALSAGLEHACGNAVVPLDADLQDPPELIEAMVAKWREGFDVVYATRARSDCESSLNCASARYFYRIFDRITDFP